MKRYKITLMTLLLATLAVGCTKDNNNTVPGGETAKAPLRIFAHQFDGNGSKLSMNPNDPTEAANWIENEYVWLNDELCTIVSYTEGGNNYYGLINNNTYDYVRLDNVAIQALYPGASFEDNDVEVSANQIVLHNLGVHFLEDDKQSMAFPLMATKASSSQDRNLYFDHLSGGVQVTLHNQSGSDKSVATLRIVAQSNSTVENLGKDGVTARWAVEGPWLPFDLVGENSENVDVKYSSAMYFTLHDDVNVTDYKTIANNGYLPLCVPITISSMDKLNVTGYAADGTQLFEVHKDFANTVNIDRNRMYTLPIINIQ